MNLVIAEGRDWIAIDKPSGMSTHNDSGRESQDAVTWITNHHGAKPGQISPVHRLDRETSGVLLFATTRESASRLQQSFSNHAAVRKFYRAVLRGRLPEKGIWDFPISDKAEGRENPAGKSAERKNAQSRFRLIRANDYLSEVEIELLTGRQHQIRKHARLAKHGIVGDTRYGEPGHAKKMSELYGVSRLMLHAEKLEIEDLSISAPVPLEFSKFFEVNA